MALVVIGLHTVWRPDDWRSMFDITAGEALQVAARLDALALPSGRLAASDDENFKGWFFGRDAAWMARGLLRWRRQLAERVIFHLAALQGSLRDPSTDEEPGRIHHQAGTLFDGPAEISSNVPRLEELAHHWQLGLPEPVEEVVVYYSVDATCLFISLIADYCRLYGTDLLARRFRHRRGAVRTIEDALRDAVAWLEGRITHSELGLLEFQCANPKGVQIQVLRDSGTAYFHVRNGRPTGLNRRAPVASLDAQGLAFQALRDAAGLLDAARDWLLELADQVRTNTVCYLWLPDEGRFAMGCDRDELRGQPRAIAPDSSLDTSLLATDFFVGLPEGREMVEGIVRRAENEQFMTDVGLRGVARRHQRLFSYWTYHGSSSVWEVNNFIYFTGLMLQGLPTLAARQAERSLYGLSAGDREFNFVDPEDGAVLLDLTTEPGPGRQRVISTNKPESPQGWSVMSHMHLFCTLPDLQQQADTEPAGSWQHELTATVLKLPTLSAPARAAWVDRPAGRREEARLNWRL